MRDNLGNLTKCHIQRRRLAVAPDVVAQRVEPIVDRHWRLWLGNGQRRKLPNLGCEAVNSRWPASTRGTRPRCPRILCARIALRGIHPRHGGWSRKACCTRRPLRRRGPSLLLRPILFPGLVVYAIDSFSLSFAPAFSAFAFSAFALAPLSLPFALRPLSCSFVETWISVLASAFACTLLFAMAFALAILSYFRSRLSFALAYGRGT